MGSTSFQTERRTDKQTLLHVKKLVEKAKLASTSANYIPKGAQTARSYNIVDPASDAFLKELMSYDGIAIQSISFVSSYYTITINRANDSLLDTISLDYQQYNANSEVEANATRIILATQSVFGTIDVNKQLLHLFPENMRLFQEAREANLSRLEQLHETLIQRTEEYRVELDSKTANLRERLDSENTAEKEKLKAEHKVALDALQAREEVLEARIKEIDNRESKIARRGIRKELQAELQQRAKKFELTEGTRHLRFPITIACISVGIYLGVLTGMYAYWGLQAITSPNITITQIISLSVKQFVVTAGFVGIWTYFIRWNNQWFDQHAREEFRLKRLGIDIDWANWVVETAMEWKKENQSEIPAELLNRLTGNLFAEEKSAKDEPNAADQLASAIFGSSASATIEAAGGKLNIDRKGIDKLAKN